MKTEQRTLDPILTGIIKNYNDAHGDALPPADNVGDFTNRIIQSKQKDKCYFLRMVVLRLNKSSVAFSPCSAFKCMRRRPVSHASFSARRGCVRQGGPGCSSSLTPTAGVTRRLRVICLSNRVLDTGVRAA
eukprot:2601113-Rhodomonas_salina.1